MALIRRSVPKRQQPDVSAGRTATGRTSHLKMGNYNLKASKCVPENELDARLEDIERKRRHCLLQWHQKVTELNEELSNMGHELGESLVPGAGAGRGAPQVPPAPGQSLSSPRQPASTRHPPDHKLTEEEEARLPLLLRTRPLSLPTKWQLMTRRQHHDINRRSFERLRDKYEMYRREGVDPTDTDRSTDRYRVLLDRGDRSAPAAAPQRRAGQGNQAGRGGAGGVRLAQSALNPFNFGSGREEMGVVRVKRSVTAVEGIEGGLGVPEMYQHPGGGDDVDGSREENDSSRVIQRREYQRLRTHRNSTMLDDKDARQAFLEQANKEREKSKDKQKSYTGSVHGLHRNKTILNVKIPDILLDSADQLERERRMRARESRVLEKSKSYNGNTDVAEPEPAPPEETAIDKNSENPDTAEAAAAAAAAAAEEVVEVVEPTWRLMQASVDAQLADVDEGSDGNLSFEEDSLCGGRTSPDPSIASSDMTALAFATHIAIPSVTETLAVKRHLVRLEERPPPEGISMKDVKSCRYIRGHDPSYMRMPDNINKFIFDQEPRRQDLQEK